MHTEAEFINVYGAQVSIPTARLQYIGWLNRFLGYFDVSNSGSEADGEGGRIHVCTVLVV
jgi:hypothetical protein